MTDAQAFDLAQARCLSQNLRLEPDGEIYNAYGIAVARYLGWSLSSGELQLRFENLTLITEWANAKVLSYGRG